MKRKEINIFSTSFLDLLSGALGAVLILFIIIPKLTTEQQSALDEQQQSQTRDAAGEKIFGVNAQLGIVCMWLENIDVDLYVKDLRTGEICDYTNTETDFGILMEDITSRVSPDDDRYELVYQQRIVPGRYLIYVNIYEDANLDFADSATVSGYVVLFPGTRNEQKINYRQIRLTTPGEDITVGTLTVTEKNITLQQ